MPSLPCLPLLQRELADCIIRNAPLDDIRILLACGAKVNEPVTQGLRPLHYAAYQKYTECVNLLLVRGSDIDAMDDIGYTAVHLCAERGYIDLLRLLLDHGAKVRFTELQPDDRVIYKSLGNPPRATLADEPLRLAIKNGHSECAELLLRNGADPNARYFLGSEINLISPLNVTFMEMLLRHGAHPDARDRAGLTPLMKACRHPQGYAAAKLLISYGADVNAMTSERHDFRSVLHYGVLSGNLGIVKLLIDHGANVTFPKELQKPTPLDFAILRGNVEMVKLLLDAGADVNCGSPIIGLPLHIALSEKIENRYAIVHLLLDRGADPNGITFDDRGPLLKPPLGEYFNSSSSTSSTGGSSSSLPYLEATDPDPRIIRLLLQYGARVIIKAQMMDPMGILKSLYRLPVDSEALDVVLEAAESFSLQGIKRCSLLSEDQRNVLLTAATTPQSLKHQCRIKIRHLIGDVGPFLVEKTQDLPIPDLIQNYLLYRVR